MNNYIFLRTFIKMFVYFYISCYMFVRKKKIAKTLVSAPCVPMHENVNLVIYFSKSLPSNSHLSCDDYSFWTTRKIMTFLLRGLNRRENRYLFGCLSNSNYTIRMRNNITSQLSKRRTREVTVP